MGMSNGIVSNMRYRVRMSNGNLQMSNGNFISRALARFSAWIISFRNLHWAGGRGLFIVHCVVLLEMILSEAGKEIVIGS